MNPRDDLEITRKRVEMRERSREQAESILRLAGYELRHTWELANGYWPDHPEYDVVRRPWWLFLTQIGLVQIGWRKSVLAIVWDASEVRGIVTADKVTKSDIGVHAYTVEKAIEYLRALRVLAERK